MKMNVFYYADKAYFGFDTSEEFINTVSQVYTGNYSDNFTKDFMITAPITFSRRIKITLNQSSV